VSGWASFRRGRLKSLDRVSLSMYWATGWLTPNDVLRVINYLNRGDDDEEASGQAAEGEPAGDRGSSSDYGWLAMVNTGAGPATASVRDLPPGSGRQNDLRVNWLTAAVDDLAYWTTHRQPDLPLELATWQPEDAELSDWETLLDDPDTDLADLDAYFAAMG
jgi:hypothetical protein